VVPTYTHKEIEMKSGLLKSALSLAVVAAMTQSAQAAAPAAAQIGYADYSKLGFVTLTTDAIKQYDTTYTRVDVVEVPVSWNVWSGEAATSWQVLIDGNVAIEGTGQGGSAVVPFTKGGYFDMVVRLCNADGCTDSKATKLLISDTDGSHLQANLPMTVDPANTNYAQNPDQIVGTYFVEWGVYGRKFEVNDIPANNLTHIIYGFIPICGGTGDNQSLKDPNPKGHALLKSMCGSMPDYSVVIHDTWAALNSTYGAPATRLDGKAVGSLDIGKGNYGNLMALKKAYPHLKVLPSIGGWTLSDPFHGFTVKANRDTFVASVKEFLKTWKFYDGVDIDWEFPGGGGANPNLGDPVNDGPAYVALMQELRVMLDELEAEYGRKYELTSAISNGYDKIQDVDYGAAIQYMDNIFMMSYDFYGAWGPDTGHQTAIYCGAHVTADKCNGTGEHAGKPEYTLDNAVKMVLAQGVPAKKLVVGAAMYARGWQDVVAADGNPIGSVGTHIVDGANNPFNGSLGGSGTDINEAAWAWEAGIMDYRGALKFMQANQNAVLGWDDVAKASFIWDDTSRTLLTLDTPRSVLAKGDYLRGLGLGGIFSWEIDGDGNGDILNAMNQAVGNKAGITDWSITCPAGQIAVSGACVDKPIVCPTGQVVENNVCVDIVCKAGEVLQGNTCVAEVTECPVGQELVNGACQDITPVCTADQELVNGVCQDKVITCPVGQELVNGACQDITPVCTADQELVNGVCQDKVITCPVGQVLVNGVCQDENQGGTEYPTWVGGEGATANGTIVAFGGACYEAKNNPGAWETPSAASWFWNKVDCGSTGGTTPVECTAGQELVNGVCQDIVIECAAGQELVNGVCQDIAPVCTTGQELVNGVCQDKTTPAADEWVGGAKTYKAGDTASYKGECFVAERNVGSWDAPAENWFWNAISCN